MSKVRIEALTGIRAIAALAVFLYHCGHYYGHGQFGWGFVGVDLFFILSGFVLTLNYRDWYITGVSKHRFVRFIRARIARIWPMHLVTLVATAVIIVFLEKQRLSILGAVANVLLIHSFLGTGIAASYNGPSWSISDEMFFYLVFPFIVCGICSFLITLKRLLYAALFLVVVVYVICFGLGWFLPTYDPFPHESGVRFVLYFFPLSRVSEFIMGILLAEIWRVKSWERNRGWLFGVAAGVLLSVVVFKLMSGIQPSQPETFTLLMILPLSVLLYSIVAIPEKEVISRFLSSKIMVKLGEWSFSFYLIHYIYIRIFQDAGFSGDIYVSSILTFLLTLLSSSLSYRYLELPLKNFITRRSPSLSQEKQVTSLN